MAGAGGKQRRGPKFMSPTDKERVLAEVMRLDRMRYTQYEIAARVGVSQAQVSIYLKQERKKYAAARLTDTAEHVAEKLAQYDDVIRQASEAFENSKRGTTADGDEVERTPEAVFLTKVLDALKAQRELLGLDAPTKSDVRAAVAQVEVRPGGLPALPNGEVDWDALAGRPAVPDPVEEAKARALPVHEPKDEGKGKR